MNSSEPLVAAMVLYVQRRQFVPHPAFGVTCHDGPEGEQQQHYAEQDDGPCHEDHVNDFVLPIVTAPDVALPPVVVQDH